MTIIELRKQKTEEFQNSPYLFWAKKLDNYIHIIQTIPYHKTLCGSSAALLGNNYAPLKRNKPICGRCLKIELERINKNKTGTK